MVLTILLGLIGLGLVIFVHESGHFLAAKAFGIEVESFALGWGRRLVGFRRGPTEYRLNIFPIGGYCKLKGEEDFKTAVEQRLDSFPATEGSLYGVSPLKRLVLYAAGPISNMLFAVLLFTIIWFVGYSYQSYSNQIVVAADYPQVYGEREELSPAERAGLRSGDRIIAVEGEPVADFNQIQDQLMPQAEKETEITVSRSGEQLRMTLVPELNEQTGSGVIGIAAWIDPVISSIPADSQLLAADLQPGDRIISYDGKKIEHALDLVHEVRSDTDRSYTLEIERNRRRLSLELPTEYTASGEPVFNAAFAAVTSRTPDYSLPGAFIKGIEETFSQISMAVHGISLLFKGLDVQQAMAGPIKITYLLGDTASAGFSRGLRSGLVTVMQLLGFISVALGFANLLPIPALDGGQMLLALYEAVSGRSLRPALYYRLQIVGFAILFSLLIFTVFSDVSFFMG